MKKIILTLCLFALSNVALADFSSGHKIKRIYTGTNGTVWVETEVQPPNTCSYWSWYLSFDSSTDGGKAVLSNVLAAKLSDSTVQLWYTNSPAPGTDQTSGCVNAFAVITGFAIT